jgi:hypothetical protein
MKKSKKKIGIIQKSKDCENYLSGFCLKDIDGGRVWNCTASKQIRVKLCLKGRPDVDFSCPYPKLEED